MSSRRKNEPGSLLSPQELDFSEAQLLNTMKLLEQAHWHYIDHVCLDRKKPNLFQFTQQVTELHGQPLTVVQIKHYCRKYDKYKKSLPTAGCVFSYGQQLLLIKNSHSPVFSLPKGKSDSGETLEQTAIREFREETGLDISHLINSETEYITIQKTRYYLVESDCLIKGFSGYNPHEIVQIGWHSIDQIKTTPERYSKQVRGVLERLL